MEFSEAIQEVLVYEGRFSPEYAKNLAEQIMMESKKLGLELPTYNLVWSTISKETLAKRDFAQELAEYIMELYYRGGYINRSEQEVDRILQLLRPKK